MEDSLAIHGESCLNPEDNKIKKLGMIILHDYCSEMGWHVEDVGHFPQQASFIISEVL